MANINVNEAVDMSNPVNMHTDKLKESVQRTNAALEDARVQVSKNKVEVTDQEAEKLKQRKMQMIEQDRLLKMEKGETPVDNLVIQKAAEGEPEPAWYFVAFEYRDGMKRKTDGRIVRVTNAQLAMRKLMELAAKEKKSTSNYQIFNLQDILKKQRLELKALPKEEQEE